MFTDRRIPKAIAAAALLAAALGGGPANAAATKPGKAWAFPPVELTATGQTANLCTTNFGDASVTVMLVITNAATMGVVAHSTPTIPAGGTACLSFTNSPTTTSAAADPTAVEMYAIIAVLSRAQGAALNNLASSLAIEDTTTQANRIVLEPLLLPAVRLPTVGD
jgi:hypothetical protein